MIKLERHCWERSMFHSGDIWHSKASESESESEVAQSCPTLCNPVDCSLPGSPVHGILQARVLEWGAIAFSRGSSRPRDRTQVSCIVGRCFTVWATREDGNLQKDHSQMYKSLKYLFLYCLFNTISQLERQLFVVLLVSWRISY